MSQAIESMVLFFLPHCSEQSTMTELRNMVAKPKLWREAHDLFGRIRDKTLRADAAKDEFLQWQYSFEEICAKTLYNMADHSAGFSSKYLPPFDDDVPLRVARIARGFAKKLGIPNFDDLFPDLELTFRPVD